MAYLLGLDREGFDAPGAPIGPLLETFVVGEIRKQVGWSKVQPEIHHFRSAAQEEVDIVLEDRRRRVVAIEVKASSAVDERDFRHLKRLRENLGGRFLTGIVLHPGREAVTFGPELHALPLTTLWRSR
jgi:predicted AAA+ superfamily ATPase